MVKLPVVQLRAWMYDCASLHKKTDHVYSHVIPEDSSSDSGNLLCKYNTRLRDAQ